MSEVLVTNDRARPVPVVMTGMPRWEVSGSIMIPDGEVNGQDEFTTPANTLFVVTFVFANGDYSGVTPGEPAALNVLSIHGAHGTTFQGHSSARPVVRRLGRKHSAVCQVLDFVIEAGKEPSTVSVELDKQVGLGDEYWVHYVLQGHLQQHLDLRQILGPVHPLT
jgi:hypothetical protein